MRQYNAMLDFRLSLAQRAHDKPSSISFASHLLLVKLNLGRSMHYLKKPVNHMKKWTLTNDCGYAMNHWFATRK